MSHPVVIFGCSERLMQGDEVQKNLSAGASFQKANISTLLGYAVSAMVLTRDRQPGSAPIARTLTAIPRLRRSGQIKRRVAPAAHLDVLAVQFPG
jgi:hypothetical protein